STVLASAEYSNAADARPRASHWCSSLPVALSQTWTSFSLSPVSSTLPSGATVYHVHGERHISLPETTSQTHTSWSNPFMRPSETSLLLSAVKASANTSTSWPGSCPTS